MNGKLTIGEKVQIKDMGNCYCFSSENGRINFIRSLDENSIEKIVANSDGISREGNEVVLGKYATERHERGKSGSRYSHLSQIARRAKV